ncbi:MAG: hypothetical protein HZB14_09900 [Actinobacteria bacterium]|nr:hypothetical protein [Actinomycetota bacterium]
MDRFSASLGARGVSAYPRALAVAVVAALAALALSAPPAGAAPYNPNPGAPYTNGPSGRFKLDGAWYVKRDPSNEGLSRRWQAGRDFSAGAGWSTIGIPHAFNAGDYSENSYTGSTAWYATEFNLPRSPRGSKWILHFDSVNFKARVWLNGREIGGHKGGYVPFELLAKTVKRGANRLVVRVDSRLNETSVPSQEERNDQLTGGWWNYGGILREVGLRRTGSLDISNVATRSRFKSRRGPVKITVLVRVKNLGKRRARLKLSGRFGGAAVRFPRARLPRGVSTEIRGTVTIRRPRLWEPLSPNLYPVTVRGAGAGYRVLAGIRRLSVSKTGALSLNGRKVRLRGVSLHEADEQVGAAWTPAVRDANLGLVTQLGARIIRSHYPFSPSVMEWADRNGILVWVQAPAFRPRESQLKSARYRANAISFTKQMVLADRAHPSVLVWSLMNEAVPAGTTYINKLVSAQKKAVDQLDPGGLVGADYAAAPEDELQHPAYRKLDVLGVNEYFGWYPGLLGSTLDINKLDDYLDYLHQAYARQALFVTEFGAEANRSGSADELGTYEFQTNYMISQMRILRDLPYLNGYFAWALKDYAVRPDWSGGNPDPSPPYSKKGLFDLLYAAKPAAAEVEREFKATAPFK